MGRRTSGLLDDLVEAPWWVGVILGIGGYLLIAYAAPMLASDNPLLEAMAHSAGRFVAPLWLVLCLVGAGLSPSRRGNPDVCTTSSDKRRTWRLYPGRRSSA